MMNPTFYTDRIKTFEVKVSNLNKRLKLLSLIRLFSFLTAIAVFYALYPVHVFFAAAAALTVIGLFIWSITTFNKTQIAREFYQRIKEINTNEQESLKGNIQAFDPGDGFIDPEHQFSFDMDIFGSGSLFQFLNRSRSEEGKSMLASLLSNNELNKKTIANKQKFVSELSGKTDFRHRFHASFSMAKTYTPDQKKQLLKWLFNEGSFFKSNALPVLSFLFPVMFIVILLLASFSVVTFNLVFYAFLLNLGIIGTKLKETNQIHSILSEHGTRLKEYAVLLSYIENETFQSPIADGLKASLHHQQETSSAILKKLGKLVDLFDNRLNLLMNVLMNGIFLWDFHCIRRLEKWKKGYKDSILHWFSCITSFDAYISLANYAFNYPEHTYPQITEERPFLSMINAGHPLINPNELVRNDFFMEERRFIIVTGANMAGKSTFLRTVGINMVLAMAGAPVCADEFIFKPVKLFTSMRASDSLQKNESYFYAELKRLKELLTMLQQESRTMVILDEILKGTNSEDKQKGSKLFLKQLVKRKATGIIATHDLSLAALEQEHTNEIQNFCFEIEIDGEDIHFDYKLKEGVTKKMNASLLMAQMGLLQAE